MDRAITENRFEVYYQPIYSLKEKCVVSLEALVRLKDEKLGAISPDEFIPLAEQTERSHRSVRSYLKSAAVFWQNMYFQIHHLGYGRFM